MDSHTIGGFTPQQILGGLWILLSLGIAIAKHPEERSGIWQLLLSVLGRLSMLRFADSPGTLHVPLTMQPSPKRTGTLEMDLGARPTPWSSAAGDVGVHPMKGGRPDKPAPTPSPGPGKADIGP